MQVFIQAIKLYFIHYEIPINNRSMFFSGDRLNPQIFNAGTSPLLILRPGEYLNASCESISDYYVNVFLRGFLVDDLKF